MAKKLKACVDCGNMINVTAKTCGKCDFTDPFGEERLKKKLSRNFFVLFIIIIVVGLFYLSRFGFTNPLEIIRQPFR